jgi:type I restriction enzyme S subunit
MSWRSLTVGDLVEAGTADIQTGPFGTQLKASDYVEDGIPVINVRNIGFGDLKPEKLEFVTDETAERLAAHLLQRQDIVFGRKGAVDRHLFVGEEQENWLQGSDCIRLRFATDEVVPRFISYLFLTDVHQKWMLAQSGNKATMASLNHDIIKRISLHIPTPTVQRDIVDILSAYDDLIKNNQRRMALLEEAVRQLYQEWFVRLCFPGHEHTRISRGFPEGWERKTIATLTTFVNRGIAPHYDDNAEGLVINQKCIRNGRLDLTFVRHQSREFRPDRQVQPGDVLVNSTGEGTLGRVAQVISPILHCTVDTHVTIVRPNAEIGRHYFGMAVMGWEPRFSTMGRGATNQTELSRGQIGEAEILVPSHSLVQQFEEFAAPLFGQVVALMEQNRKLRAARDLLLPRLMSGEIAV